MGLDMYLTATRRFNENDPEVDRIMKAAQTTLDAVKASQVADECEYGLFVSGFVFKDDQTKHAALVADEARLPREVDGYVILGVNGGQVKVEATAIYWRKANAVHNWFVQNVQGGVDECQRSVLDAEHLMALHGLCKRALKAYAEGDLSQASALLPPVRGFFFGSQELDEWWAKDLEHTATELERVLQYAAQNPVIELAYHASW